MRLEMGGLGELSGMPVQIVRIRAIVLGLLSRLRMLFQGLVFFTQHYGSDLRT